MNIKNYRNDNTKLPKQTLEILLERLNGKYFIILAVSIPLLWSVSTIFPSVFADESCKNTNLDGIDYCIKYDTIAEADNDDNDSVVIQQTKESEASKSTIINKTSITSTEKEKKVDNGDTTLSRSTPPNRISLNESVDVVRPESTPVNNLEQTTDSSLEQEVIPVLPVQNSVLKEKNVDSEVLQQGTIDGKEDITLQVNDIKELDVEINEEEVVLADSVNLNEINRNNNNDNINEAFVNIDDRKNEIGSIDNNKEVSTKQTKATFGDPVINMITGVSGQRANGQVIFPDAVGLPTEPTNAVWMGQARGRAHNCTINGQIVQQNGIAIFNYNDTLPVEDCNVRNSSIGNFIDNGAVYIPTMSIQSSFNVIARVEYSVNSTGNSNSISDESPATSAEDQLDDLSETENEDDNEPVDRSSKTIIID